ncbi:DUF4062 domain-containing protein [Chryseobacterium caseinilyticum]|uniref:DUF4062 domain-containing protein n=1 Tax=Chryseobacterium caseinilyticum TaxID=2771428 RepID=A0ABR8ZAC6_9FLAO|nr:DUF4062 domain-containing protein [Chryseobacterium caseinilyticum]MBD8082269.1 DUF4062 domain-containing protein [Chryseobacterium caseinilyticum]
MPKKFTQYSILLSSPTDLESERNEIPNLINELNNTYGKSNDVHFDLIKWETHSGPGITHEHTQQIINEDIGDEYDIFLGIIWKKFGTQTAVAESGTEEEFLRALKRFENGENIQILFYFKSEAIPVDEIIPEQITKIKNFKEGLRQNNILYWNFKNVEELINQLRIHLPKRTDNLLSNNSINKVLEVDKGVKNSIDDIEEIGVLDFLIQFEDFMANANLALTNITDATAIIGNEFRNKTDEINKIKKLPNFNKNSLAGILTRTAKNVDDYTNRLLLETPIYKENYEAAVKIGSIYINSINKDNIDENIEDLNSFLESVKTLKTNIPKAINGMEGFYNEIRNLPNLYSVFNKAKNKLLNQLDVLQSTLKASYDITHEFEGELEYKLKL